MMIASMAFALAAVAAATAKAPDPYALPPHGEIETMARAGQFGEPGADARIERWLVTHSTAPRADRLRLAHRLCEDYGAMNWAGSRAKACSLERSLDPGGKEDIGTALLLRDQPPLRARGSARVPLTLNGVGSRSATVTAGGVSALWFVDSGAQISVVSQSLATRIGVRMLDGKVEVGTTTAPVHGGVGIVDVLRIGDATVENVPVLVLPDAQLTIANLPPIPAILGLPAMVAFRRVAWLDHGKTLALGDMAPTAPADAPKIYWHEDGVGIPLSGVTSVRGAHFDSGANVSYLYAAGHALLDGAGEASAVERTVRTGGAGGVIERKRKEYPQLSFAIGGAPIVLKHVAIHEEDVEGAARLGDDVLAQLSVLALDFDAMKAITTP
jgi:hypothetical protein